VGTQFAALVLSFASMKIPGMFLLITGCVWALFVVWMFLTLAGIAQFAWTLSGIFYWVGMLIGPVALIVGSGLVLSRYTRTSGVILVAIGCLILTSFALYDSVVGMQQKPLQAPPRYSFYAVMLIVMLLADIAGLRVVRQRLRSPAAMH
jgi:hypothetical protein